MQIIKSIRKRCLLKNKFSCFIFVQEAQQTSSKTNAREYATPQFKFLATTDWKLCQFWKKSRSADVKVQSKAREYLIKAQHFLATSRLSRFSPHPSASASRCGTDNTGRGALEPHPKTALERSDLADKLQFRESHAEADTKKNPDQIPVLSKKRIIILGDISPWNAQKKNGHKMLPPPCVCAIVVHGLYLLRVLPAYRHPPSFA